MEKLSKLRKKRKGYPDLAPFCRASLTVEATFVLPIFLFAMMAFLYFLRISAGYCQIQEGLTQTARAASQYGYLDTNRFYSYMEKNGGKLSYIPEGSRGISLFGSYISPSTQMITVKASYRVSLPVPFFNHFGITISQQTQSRVFSGVDYWGTKDGTGEDERIVYVTEHGTVYHLHRSCTYLKPSIRMVFGDEVYQERNHSGGKYKSCSLCMKKSGVNQALYITSEGDRYHGTLSCSGLKRTIREISLSQAAGMRACSKCGT